MTTMVMIYDDDDGDDDYYYYSRSCLVIDVRATRESRAGERNQRHTM